MDEKCVWHVVTSQGDIILGVYGAKILSEAQKKAADVEHRTGFPAFVTQVSASWQDRPQIGTKLVR